MSNITSTLPTGKALLLLVVGLLAASLAKDASDADAAKSASGADAADQDQIKALKQQLADAGEPLNDDEEAFLDQTVAAATAANLNPAVPAPSAPAPAAPVTTGDAGPAGAPAE